jgi:hypothetical protein
VLASPAELDATDRQGTAILMAIAPAAIVGEQQPARRHQLTIPCCARLQRVHARASRPPTWKIAD